MSDGVGLSGYAVLTRPTTLRCCWARNSGAWQYVVKDVVTAAV